MLGRLEGKVALVTGAYSGIGQAISSGLRAHGARVYATDAKPSDAADLLDLDVTDGAAWQRVVDEILNVNGRLDILVNNAGVASYQSLTEFTEQDWNQTIAVNMYGPAAGIRAVVPSMLKQRSGSIINVSSIYAVKAVAGEAAYHASKAALVGITRNAAASYSKYGVRVNAILPGLIATPMTQNQDPELNEYFVASTPMGRVGLPADLVGPSVFLASDESAYVTGVALPVDGGFLAV